MTELNFYEGKEFPFTKEWYAERHHAPHLEQPIHRGRMEAVATLAHSALYDFHFAGLVDLGAGDGGMIELIRRQKDLFDPESVRMWGYDVQPSNVEYARHHRGVDVKYCDFETDPIIWGDLVVITEVLEHLEKPHDMVKAIYDNARGVIASSPSRETAESHDPVHAWAWDMEGYKRMFKAVGFTIVEHKEVVGDYAFQVLFGVRTS